MLGQDAKHEDPKKHLVDIECQGDCQINQASTGRAHTLCANNLQSPSHYDQDQSYNPCHDRYHLLHFRLRWSVCPFVLGKLWATPVQLDVTCSLGEGRSEVELWSCPLINMPVMPKKFDGKANFVPTVPVVRPPPPHVQTPSRPATHQPIEAHHPSHHQWTDPFIAQLVLPLFKMTTCHLAFPVNDLSRLNPPAGKSCEESKTPPPLNIAQDLNIADLRSMVEMIKKDNGRRDAQHLETMKAVAEHRKILAE